MEQDALKDKIRGCLMAGAAGDALGYEVEFMSRRSILSRFGENGITKFALDSNGEALISDDTQMTLFTANGLLTGITMNRMEHSSCKAELIVMAAYLDWFYTQTREEGKHEQITWLRELPEMYHKRAPGNTCMGACANIIDGKDVMNDSKGCGGIMRVAPMALLVDQSPDSGRYYCSLEDLAEGGCYIAEQTHQHPLGFLPAGLLTVLLYKLLPLTPAQAQDNIDNIVSETLSILGVIRVGKYEEDKQYLKELTEKAVRLAYSDISDADAIRKLGEGWVAEETWAIALYSAIRHIDSVEDAIIASVNHDGDSDSTGSVCGNIMGAIYGYEHIKERNIFCPEGKQLEETLELSEIILALADDLASGCMLATSLCMPQHTPEGKQWFERYVMMKPAGIGAK